MTLTSSVTLDKVQVDGTSASKGELLEHYSQVLGKPNRWIMPGDPPPYGHRNNVIHFYDELGFFLREHHATYLIEGIDIVLDTTDSIFPTKSAYSGELHVCGVSVYAGMPFAEFTELCSLKFSPHLGHAWYLDGEKISIQFEVKHTGAKGKQKQELISELAVGF